MNLGVGTVTRTVQFFRIYTDVEDGALVPFDNAALCRAIRAVETSADPYLDSGDGDVQTCAYLDDPADTERFSLAKIRRHSRPLTEQGMVRGTLALQPGIGLMDPIHIRLFPNNIMGAEYNDDGPRASRLRPFLSQKIPEQYANFRMTPIYDSDVVERLGKLDEISLFHFQVDKAALDLQVAERNFFRGIFGSSDMAEMATIEVIMRVSKRNEHGNTEEVKAEARALLDSPSGVQKVKVRGREDGGKSEEIDLLKDRIISRQHMMRLDAETSGIEPASAYRAIGEAYDAVRERIPEVDFVIPD
jgi:hypothetical protein